MSDDLEDKNKLIFEIYEYVQDFMKLYRKDFIKPEKGVGKTSFSEKERDEMLFYLALTLRDALVSVSKLCDPTKENIGIALATTHFYQRIRSLFPEHAAGLPGI